MHPTTNSPGFLPKHGSLGSRDDRPGTKPGVRRTPGVGTPRVKSGTPRVKSCIHTFLISSKGFVLQKKELLAHVVPRLAAFFVQDFDLSSPFGAFKAVQTRPAGK